MKNSHLPVFGNTCGKLYEDYILLASENRERTLPLNSVKKITFSKSIALGSLLFMLLPCVLFVMPQFLNADDIVAKILMYGVGIVFLAVSIVKAEKKYAVKLYTKSGTVLKVRLIKENMRDAQKFVLETTKLLHKNKAAIKAAAADERLAENIFAAAPVLSGER
jgi:hypothetical protein